MEWVWGLEAESGRLQCKCRGEIRDNSTTVLYSVRYVRFDVDGDYFEGFFMNMSFRLFEYSFVYPFLDPLRCDICTWGFTKGKQFNDVTKIENDSKLRDCSCSSSSFVVVVFCLVCLSSFFFLFFLLLTP